MKKKRVTSTDIAKKAGVSQSTVSMVLNRKYNVSFSKETVEKVEQAAKELGYVMPKRKVRKAERREKHLAVFCPNLTNPYYVMLLQGVEMRAKDEEYTLFVCNTQRDLSMEERYLKMMPSLNPMGIIYMCNPSECFMGMIERLAERIPVVIVNNQNERLSLDAVELDNSKLGRLMARHLLDLGHKKVAYITPPLTTRQKQRSKRTEGFLKEFDKEGLKSQVIVKAANEQMDIGVPNVDSEYRMGYELTKELLREEEGLTAIVGLNDMIALGILDALYELKYRVPHDISVMGCDNILFGKMHKVALTTIEHFVVFKGRDACDIIMKKIKLKHTELSEMEPASIYHVEYEPKLIVRGTTSYAKIRN